MYSQFIFLEVVYVELHDEGMLVFLLLLLAEQIVSLEQSARCRRSFARMCG
jgi:hypothetical protein